MATIKISDLNEIPASTVQYVVADDGTTTNKVSVDSLVNLPSGIKSDNAEIQCTSTNIAVSGHYIPMHNSLYDIGSAEYKVRHLFLSDNSLYMGNNKLNAVGDELLFTKSDDQVVKTCIVKTDLQVPASSASPGKKGEIAVDDTHFYLCWQNDQWKRLALTTFEDF